MKTKYLRLTAAFLFVTVFSIPSYSQYYFPDAGEQCIDPVICRLDSMAFSLFTRDKFFVNDADLLSSINLPYDQIPKFSDEELKEKMKRIPSLVPLNYNPTVKKFIELFAYKRRGLMARCLANSQIYFPGFEEALDKRGLPIELKYLPIVESAFNPVAISRAGATGLWQLMYGTGTELGLSVNSYIDERRDPIRSTEAAIAYLQKLYNLYGDWHLVLAAYNSGPGNVNKAIARAGGVKNFWAIQNFLPAETRSYVPTYIAAVFVMYYYKDFKLVSSEPKRDLYAVDTVLITSKVSLKHISNLLSIGEDELQFLNPSIKTGVIPYTADGFALNLPINYFALFEARKQEIMNDSSQMVREFVPLAATAGKTIWYKVRSKKETLASVAAKHGVSAGSIKKWNRLKGSTVYVGQKLKIVTPPSLAVPASYIQAFASKIIEKPNTGVAITPELEAALPAIEGAVADTATEALSVIQKDSDCNCIFHVVQPGDTLWNISKKYQGVTLDKLKADNKYLFGRPLKIGDIVKIFL